MTAAGLALGFGAGQRWGDRYGALLAAPVRRRSAVLVGINRYGPALGSREVPWPVLGGCGTDVALQRDLLVSRFGFDPGAIAVLVDEQATWANIDGAIAAATEGFGPEDLFIFHFSGYGGQALVPSVGDAPGQRVRVLVPADGASGGDWPEALLLKRCQGLPTQQVAIVIDASDGELTGPLQGAANNGVLRVRSRPGHTAGRLSASRLEQWQALDRSGTGGLGGEADLALTGFGGLVMRASAPATPALELHWAAGWAGAFTRSLVQHLWQSTPATAQWIDLAQSHRTVETWIGGPQTPLALSTKSLRPSKNGGAFLLGDATLRDRNGPAIAPADGLIGQLDGDGALLRLGGLPAAVFEAAAAQSIYRVLTSTPPDPENAAVPPSLFLQGRDRQGFQVLARPANLPAATPLTPGTAVQEWVRVLPKQLDLAVALDPALERIERIDAISALSAHAPITPINPGDRLPDVWFTRLTNPDEPTLGDRYGLLSLGGDVLTHTLGDRGEAVKPAVQRLIPALESHLAQKHLRLLESQGSAQLPVRITLESGDRLASRPVIALGSRTAPRPDLRPDAPPTVAVSSGKGQNSLTTIRLAAGKPVQYRIDNPGDRPIWVALIGFNGRGNSFAFHRSEPLQVAPGGSELLAGGGTWIPANGPASIHTYVICAAAPCDRLQEQLSASRREQNPGGAMAAIADPLAVSRALWQDLHHLSQPKTKPFTLPNDAYGFQVEEWAVFEVSYRLT
jgi:hypothetical protein